MDNLKRRISARLVGETKAPAYTTTPVNVVQTKEDLFRYLLNDMWGNTAVLIPLYQAQEILS